MTKTVLANDEETKLFYHITGHTSFIRNVLKGKILDTNGSMGNTAREDENDDVMQIMDRRNCQEIKRIAGNGED